MKLALALSSGWRDDLGSLTMLATVGPLADQHRLLALVPAGELPCPPYPPHAVQIDWRCYGEQELAAGALEADVLVVPLADGDSSWASQIIAQAPQAVVLFAAGLCTTPQLWPELAARADGVLLSEPCWCALLRTADPDLPTLYLAADATQMPVAASPISGPIAMALPYLLTWSPATEPSIVLLTEALALLAARRPELQLVVLGGRGCPIWPRWARAFDVGQRCWLLGVDAVQHVDELIAGALATWAPITPEGSSAALWQQRAQAGAPPHIALAPGEQEWVTLAHGTPLVQCEAHDAARTLTGVTETLLALDADTRLHLASLRQQHLAHARAAQLAQVRPFLEAVLARRAHHGRHAETRPSRSGSVAQLVGLSTAALASMNLPAIGAHTARSIAQGIAGLMSESPR